MHTIGGAGVLLTFLLFAFSAFARDHEALNGPWRLIPTKSDFAGQSVIQTGTVTIENRQGVIIITRNFAYDGAGGTTFYRDEMGTQNGATIRRRDLTSKTRWDHGVLKVTTTRDGLTTVEEYSLAPDDSMIVNVLRPDHRAITLIFERESR